MEGTALRDATEESRGEIPWSEMSAPTRWVLLEADRRVLVAAMLLGVVALFGGALLADVAAVTNDDSLTRLFSSLVVANVTLVTVAITIIQLILSRELAAPDELHDRIRQVIEYRHDVEAAADVDVSPVTPDEFLEFIAAQIREHAESLRASAAGDVSPTCRAAVDDYAATLVDQSDRIEATLEERPVGSFDTLLTILNADLTRDVYVAERLRTGCDDALPPAATRELDDVYSLLEYMGVARQYFKTLYLQRELAVLSRRLLYVGVPAVASSTLTVWLYGHPGGAVLRGPALAAAVLAATVVALAPLAVLVAYILRLTTITRQTASLVPFKIGDRSPL